jgi:hypothetical protein
MATVVMELKLREDVQKFNYETNEILWDDHEYCPPDDYIRYLIEKHEIDLS